MSVCVCVCALAVFIIVNTGCVACSYLHVCFYISKNDFDMPHTIYLRTLCRQQQKKNEKTARFARCARIAVYKSKCSHNRNHCIAMLWNIIWRQSFSPNSCRPISKTHTHICTILFYGLSHSKDMALYVFELILHTLLNLNDIYKKETKTKKIVHLSEMQWVAIVYLFGLY